MKRSSLIPPSYRLLVSTGLIALLIVGAMLGLALPSAGDLKLTVRGKEVNPRTFSFTTILSRSDKDVIEGKRSQLFSKCMKRRGFTAPPSGSTTPADVLLYEQAATGDDGSQDAIRVHEVQIAPDRTAQIYVTWTPQSCLYQSYQALGVDAYQFEATRQQIQILLARGDSKAVAKLEDLTEDWAKCMGASNVNPQDLLNTIDQLARNAYGQNAQSCLTDDLLAKATKIRASAHIDVGVDNQDLVNAWASLVDAERTAAGLG